MRRFSWLLLGVPALVAVACGGDDDDTGAGAGAKGGASGKGGSAGKPAAGKGGTDAGTGASAGERNGAGGTSSGKGGTGGHAGNTAGESAGGDSGAGGAASPTHDDTLKGLGFDTDLGGPKGPDGADLPSDYNPLRKGITSFRPRAETYVAGLLWDAGQGKPAYRDILFDDRNGPARYGRLPYTRTATDTWTNSKYKNGIAADIDGDGFDEFFVAYYVVNTAHLEYVIIDPNDGTTDTGTLDAAAPQPTQQVVEQNYAQPSLAKGDFDGSGRDQIAIGWFGLDLVKVGAGRKVTVTKRSLDIDNVTADREAVFVAAGDLDGDKNDELAMTYSTGNVSEGRVRIYDGTKIVRDVPMAYVDPNPTWGARTCRQAQVSIADIDGDHLGEVVFFGRTYGNGYDYRWQVFLMDDLVNHPDSSNPWLPFHQDSNASEGVIPRPFTTLDFNGDGVKDIFAYGHIYYATDAQGNFQPTPTDLAAAGPAGVHDDRPRAGSGDVDGDGKEDLLLEDNNRVNAVGLNDIAEVEDKQRDTREWGHIGNTVGDGYGWNSPIIIAGNVDHDSPVMRYDGDHELLFTDPHLIAVVSSPPYVDGIGQDIDDTTSTFGQSKGTSNQTENTVGFHVGFSVGYKTDFLFGEASFKINVETAFDHSAFESHSITRSIAYTTDGGQDMVVFTSIPFDVYYYTIVDSPDASEVGEKFTINIPRAPQTITADPAFFNAHTGETGLKIDKSVLNHELGDPSSYPTRTDRDAIANISQSFFGDLATVGQTGVTTSTVELETEQGTTDAMSLDVTFEWEVSAKSGPSVGGSFGFNYGHSYTLTATSSTTFEGSVGAIPEKKFADNVYSYGLMAYPKRIGNEQFFMLDYWVE